MPELVARLDSEAATREAAERRAREADARARDATRRLGALEAQTCKAIAAAKVGGLLEDRWLEMTWHIRISSLNHYE